MVGKAVAYVRFLSESDSREAELASLVSWRRVIGIFMLLFGCLSGAMFTTMLYLTVGPDPSAWRSLAFPAVLFAWAFFVSLGVYVYLGWKARRTKEDNALFVAQHTGRAVESENVESEGKK